jgi:integrase
MHSGLSGIRDLVYEQIVLHDQEQSPRLTRRTAMAMKYQKGTVYLRGQKVKMWYGKYTIYIRDQEGKEVSKRRNIPLCPKANTPKWKVQQMLNAIILKETAVPARTTAVLPDDSATFRWFVQERYIPMRQGGWSPAYKKTNTYEIEHYLVSHFGRVPLRELGTFEIQIWLNGLAEKGYSQAVVRHCFSNIRAIICLAKKQKYLSEDPGEEVTMPLTNPIEKPRMTHDQMLALIGAVKDAHDLCLLYVGIFCGPRASEVMGLQWKSWTGESLMPYGTAYEGQFYQGRFKTKASKGPIPVAEQVRPIIEAWRRTCQDSSPEALMFPTFGRGKRKGQAVPRWGKNFLKWRIRPVARELGIPESLVTFQVMRRTLGTDMQKHGTLKDAQGALRHASIKTTGDVYVQIIGQSVLDAVNSRTRQILAGWEAPTASETAPIVPKARQRKAGKETREVPSQLDQVGPSGEGEVLASG